MKTTVDRKRVDEEIRQAIRYRKKKYGLLPCCEMCDYDCKQMNTTPESPLILFACHKGNKTYRGKR